MDSQLAHDGLGDVPSNFARKPLPYSKRLPITGMEINERLGPAATSTPIADAGVAADSPQAECRDVTQDDLSSESSLISGPARSDEAASDPPTEMEEQPDTHEASVAAPEAPEHPSDASRGVSIAAESMDGAAVSNDARDRRRAALLHDVPICLKRSRGD